MAAAAVLAYIYGGANATLNGLVRGPDSEVVVRRQYLEMAVADQQQAIGDLRAARQDLSQLQSRLAAEQQSERSRWSGFHGPAGGGRS